MDTQTLQVFSLRGMDERWIVDAQDALNIQDMTWTSNDSWRTSGGFTQLFTPDLFKYEEPPPLIIVEIPEDDREIGNQPGSESDPESEPEENETSSEPIVVTARMLDKGAFGRINSIHWFAQHNGARQWLIYEEENASYNASTKKLETNGTVSLKAFYGSISKSFAEFDMDETPSITLRQFLRAEESGTDASKTNEIKDRSLSELSVRTQSQSYGGRIYLVNGFDEPLVFDGEICERAGFAQRPPSPTIIAGTYNSTTTFPFAVGDWHDEVKVSNSIYWMNQTITVDDYWSDKPRGVGFYSHHYNMPYWGLGSISDATIGAGDYSFQGAGITPKESTEFSNAINLRMNYYGNSQLENRLCGFQYKVTYVNDRGQESEPSSASSIASVRNGRGGKKKCRHGKSLVTVNLPIGPKECVARRIYRTRNVYDSNGNLYTKGEQRSFYFLSEISDNMTTQFVDGHPDTSLGSLLDTMDLGNFPSKTKYLAVFKNTMFSSGSDLNQVEYSAPLFPEVFPSDNVIVVGDDDGGPIVGMRSTKNALVVFKTRGIYLIKGDPLNGFVAQTLNKDIGCIAPNSIAEIPGLGLAFLSEKSVYLLEGALENTGSPTGVVNIGGEIPNQLERMNSSAAIRASSAVYQRDKEYWLSIPVDGSHENNMCLIYHYEVGSWSIRKDFPADCMVVSKDHRGYLFMGSHNVHDDYRAGILVYTRGTDRKGLKTITRDYTTLEPDIVSAIPINSIYETVSNDYQSVFTNFRPAHVMAYAVGYGDNGLDVNTRVNRSINQVRAISQTSDQQDPNETYPVYGSAKFGIDQWIAYRPTVLRYDISTTNKGPVRELSISFASADGNKIEIIGYDLEAKVGEQRSIKPLNKALRPSGR